MSSPVSFITQLLRASDGNELVHAMRQSHDYNINEEAAPETFLDLLLVKAEALAFGPTSTRLVVELINRHLSHFKDAKFASNNINLLCRICDFLFLTLLPRKLEICKTYGFNSNHECSDLFAILELITKKIIQKNNLDPTITCSRPIMKAIVEVLFQFVNDFNGSENEFTSSVDRYGAFGKCIQSFATAHETFANDAFSYRRQRVDYWFCVFECMGSQLTQSIERSQDSIEDENTNKFRVERVARVVVEIVQLLVPTIDLYASNREKQKKMWEWSKSSVAPSIARNEQFWKGIQAFLLYGASHFKGNDTSSSNSYSTLLSRLVERLSFVIPKPDDVNHRIVGEEFVLCITSAPFVQFVLERNRLNKQIKSYNYYDSRGKEPPKRNDTLAHYLNLLCNIAKVKPSSFRNVIMNEETGALSRITKLFDAVADGCEHDIDRNLSTAFVWFGLIVDDFYKNEVESVKSITADDIVFPLAANSEQQLQEGEQDKNPQHIIKSNSATSHPLANIIQHFCNTVLTKSLSPSNSFRRAAFNILHIAFGLDVLLRNFFPAGKRITWPSLTGPNVGECMCCISSDLLDEDDYFFTDAQHIASVSRVFNRLNDEHSEANRNETDEPPPSFLFIHSLQFARCLLVNRSELPEADRVQVLKLIASVAPYGDGGRSSSLWLQTVGEREQMFVCLMRLIEVSTWDSVVEFELVSRIFAHFLVNCSPFEPPKTSTMWSLGRTLRRMDGPEWATAFAHVMETIEFLRPVRVEHDDAVNVEFCSVLAEFFPLIITTANSVLSKPSSPSSKNPAEKCNGELFGVAWLVFTHLTTSNQDGAPSKNEEELLSVFYRPEFAAMMIVILDTTFHDFCDAMEHCCELLVGLHERSDSLSRSMDAIVKNDRVFYLLHRNMQQMIKCASDEGWDIGDELRDVYQQVCSVVLKKNENEIMMPRRREREED